MSTYDADRIRIEVETDGVTRVIELAARGDHKVKVLLRETPFPAADAADGVERAAIDFGAMGPTLPVEDATGATMAVEG